MLDVLLKSRTRRKLLGFLALNPDGRFYLRQIARELKESVHAVRMELQGLEKAGLVDAENAGRFKFFSLNAEYPFIKELKSIVMKMKSNGFDEFKFTDFSRRNKLERNLKKVLKALVQKYGPERIIVFGSLASGVIGPASDIDILIVKETNKRYFDRISDVTRICDYDVGIDFLVYTPEEYDEALKSNTFFKDEIIGKGKVLYERAA